MRKPGKNISILLVLSIFFAISGTAAEPVSAEKNYETYFINLDTGSEAPAAIYAAYESYVNSQSGSARVGYDFYDYYITDYRYVQLYLETDRTWLKDEATAAAFVSTGTVQALTVNLRQYDENDNLVDSDLETETNTCEVYAATSGTLYGSDYAQCNFGVMSASDGSTFAKQITVEF